MDFAIFVMLRSSKIENFNFLNQRFQIWWLISGMEFLKKYTISAQYLLNYT